jgi:MSHA biogenesis protein MshG
VPQFAYTARDAGGARIDGVLESNDTNALAETLTAQGLLLIRAEPHMAGAAAGSLKRLFEPPVGLLDMYLFCRQMATLLKAGVPLLRALKGLEESSTNGRFTRILAALREQLEAGRELSASLRQQPLFNDYVINMVRVGETTGKLPEVFRGLGVQLAFERENRAAVRSALRYPAFVIATALAALIAVNLFVIPSFAKVYKSMKAELPAITKVLVALSDAMVNYWPVLLLGGGLLVVGAMSAVRRPAGRLVWDSMQLRLPVIGSLVRKASLARFTKSFGLALDAGVPVVLALDVANGTTGNIWLSERIANMKLAAERGESLARSARATGVFTPTILQMIAVGEETGSLGEMMNEVADHYQREVDHAVKDLAAKIEPLMILVLGGAILVFALGVFLPLWDLSRLALRR